MTVFITYTFAFHFTIFAWIQLQLSQTTISKSLYLSKTSGRDDGNCTIDADPCKTWDYVTSRWLTNSHTEKSFTLWIDRGVYPVHQRLVINKSDHDWSAATYQIIGRGSEEIKQRSTNISNSTVLKTHLSTTDDLLTLIGKITLQICCLTIFPTVKNNSSSVLAVFHLVYGDSIKVTDVGLNGNVFGRWTNNTANSVTVQFSRVSQFDGDVHNIGSQEIYFENIQLLNVYSDDLYIFEFYHNDYYNICLSNIELNGLHGDNFFEFDSNNYSIVSMDNININSKGLNVNGRILYYWLNYGSQLIIRDSIFTNIIFSSIYATAFDFYSNNNMVKLFNVSFENVTWYDYIYDYNSPKYGLIYIHDRSNISINQCRFENNNAFLSLIHCATDSYCNITLRNCLFKNNTGYKYEIGRNNNRLFRFDANANAQALFENNTFDIQPQFTYDLTSSITVEGTMILNSSNKFDDNNDSDNNTNAYNYNYLSTVGTDSNDCSNPRYPCATWKHLTNMTPYDFDFKSDSTYLWYFDVGEYSIDDSLYIRLDSSVNSTTFTMTGQGNDQTMLEVVGWGITVFSGSGTSLVTDAAINIEQLKYIPLNVYYGRLAYFSYIPRVKLSNIDVDGSQIASMSTVSWLYDMIYVASVDVFIASCINVYDMNRRDGYADYSFRISSTNSIIFSDITYLFSENALEMDSDYVGYFIYLLRNDNSVAHFTNIAASNYYLKYGFYIVDNDNSNFTLANVALTSISGEYLFYIYSNYGQTLHLDSLTVNGKIDGSVVYFGNNYGELIVKNSNLSDIFVASTGMVFEFISGLADNITFENVIFSNMETKNYGYGLIHISSSFNVMISNCTFVNNKNFAGIIHCSESSHCNVSITNSVMQGNDGLCFDGVSLLNGIYLENGTQGYLTITNSLFIGIPWIYNDSSTIMTIDDATYSMMIDTTTNNTDGDLLCASTLFILITSNMYVNAVIVSGCLSF